MSKRFIIRNPFLLHREGVLRSRGEEVRISNILIAKVISETLKPTFGPKGMSKLVVDKFGEMAVTNDGATILDKITKEPLPYSHIIVNGWPSITDLKGSYTSVTESFDSTVNVKVTHLGYYIFDTIVSANQVHNFELIPSSIGLTEIVIHGKDIEKSTQIGNLPGLMKLNHKIAHFLP